MQKKICKLCKVEKPLSQFAKHPDCKFGVKTKCNQCTKETKKPWTNGPERVCRECGATFRQKHYASKGEFCSNRCSARYKARHKHQENLATISRKYTVDLVTGCWVWNGQKDRDGYGIQYCLKKVRAHRLVYELHRGPLLEGLQLDHLCFNPSCVNPDHLEPVPFIVNRRRARNVKLNINAVLAIRRLFAAGKTSQTVLAKRFDVARNTISRVVNFRRWTKDVPNQEEVAHGNRSTAGTQAAAGTIAVAANCG